MKWHSALLIIVVTHRTFFVRLTQPRLSSLSEKALIERGGVIAVREGGMEINSPVLRLPSIPLSLLS